MKNKFLMLGGLLAPVVYAATVILGGLLRPDYSHMAQPVSDLIASGTPNKALLDALFGIYNLLTIAFAWGLLQHSRANPQQRAQAAGRLGALTLAAEGVFGFVTLFFPEDAGGLGTTISGSGQLHIVFAGLSSLTTMLAILLVAFWLWGNPRLRGYAVYSFLSVGAVFVSGGLAAASVASQSPLAGLVERLTIGGFLQWLLVIAWGLGSAAATNPPSVRTALRQRDPAH